MQSLQTHRVRLVFQRLALFLASALVAGPVVASPVSSEEFSAILESQGPYSALFRVSPESGDLVGHVFRTDSVLGRRILEGCLVGMPCVLDSVRTRAFDSAVGFGLGFADQPAGWREITAAEGARVGSAIEDYRSEVVTRYGVVAADRENLTLLWRGKPLWPAGSGSFSVVRHVSSWGQGELLLVQNTGGSACPALYRWIEVSQRGVRASPEFGTCSDLAYPFLEESPEGQPQAVVRMVEHVGPLGTEALRRKAGRTRVEFVFSGGQLTQNGPGTARGDAPLDAHPSHWHSPATGSTTRSASGFR
jgi:hypothetical protein